MASLQQSSNDLNANSTLMDKTLEPVKTTAYGHEDRQNNSLCYRYSCLLADHPVIIFVFLLVAIILCGVIATVAYDLPNFSDPIKGFEARGTEISQRIFSHRNLNFPDSGAFTPLSRPGNNPRSRAGGRQEGVRSENRPDGFENSTIRDAIYFNATGNETVYAASPNVETKFVALDGEKGDPSNTLEFCTSIPLSRLARIVVVPKKTKHNLFSLEAVRSICNIENELIRTHPSFVNSCSKTLRYDASKSEVDESRTLSWSLGNVIAVLNNRMSCEDIQEEDVENTRQLLQECAPFYEHGVLTEPCETPECAAVPPKCVTNGLVYRVFHYLTPSSFVDEVHEDTFKLRSTIVFLPIAIMRNFDALWDIYMDIFDGRVVTNGNVKVAALEFGIKYDLFATYLQSDTVFLGLGAFAVVVIIIIYVGSPFLTAMTLLNMVMSLVLAYFAYKTIFQLPFFPFINIAAAVLVIGIGADDTFVFVDIWKKARADLSDSKSQYDRASVVHETLRHASVTMFVTSFTTGSALYASAVSSITAVKCFAIFAGTAIVANFIFTVTWLPVVVIINDMLSRALVGRKTNGDNQSDQVSCFGFIGSCCTALSEALCSFLTKVFTVYLRTAVFKLRFIWIVLFFGLAVGGFFVVFVSPKLQLPSKSEFPVFRSSHPIEKYSDYKGNYNFEKDRTDLLPYIAIWGLKAVDNGNHWDPDSTGSVKYDDQFDLSKPIAQEWLYYFCHQMRNQSFISKTHQSYCFIEYLKDTLQSPCTEDGIPDPCCGREDFPFPPDIFHTCSSMICNSGTSCLISNGLFQFGPWFKDGKLVALSIFATSTYKLSMDYNLMDKLWKTADTWTNDQMEDAPPGLSRGWFISQSLMQLHFYDLQGSLATGAPMAMGISLGIAAAVLLLTTRNILISIYAMISISGAVFVTIASLVLLGWELNIFESAILSLAVGLSVDFTIHYGVAYRLAPFKDKKRRTEVSIEALVCAITVAALSTFAAGAMMMPATVLTYVQLGTFLMLVMTISWSYATFFFLALCRAIGPHGNFMQIPIPRCLQCDDDSDGSKSLDHQENGNIVGDQNEPLQLANTCDAGNHCEGNLETTDDGRIVTINKDASISV